MEKMVEEIQVRVLTPTIFSEKWVFYQDGQNCSHELA